MNKTISELPDPVAHIYPSDLEKFREHETFAHCYSVAVGCPDECSAPLYTLSQLVEYGSSQDAEIARLLETVGRLNQSLNQIGDLAHDKSTGPAVPDAYWDIRQMAYEGQEEVALTTKGTE